MMLSAVRSFDLVLLEESEEYVSDAACSVVSPFPLESNATTWSQFVESLKSAHGCRNKVRKGRIRIGTKSLIFEPDAFDSPILKLHFQNITSITDSVDVSKGIYVSCTRVTSIPTTIYNGKTRFLSAYDVHIAKGVPSSSTVDNMSHGSDPLGFVFIFAYTTATMHEEQLSEYMRLWGSYKLNVDIDMFKSSKAGGFSQSLLQPREKPILGCASSSIHPDSVYCWRLKRMVRYGGYAALTDRAFYFEPSPNFSRKSCKRIPIDRILHIFKRDSGIPSKIESATALEIISLPEESIEKRIQNSRKLYSCIYVEFKLEDDREKFTSTLRNMVPRAFYALESRAFRNDMTQLWRRGVLPNFQYIDFLNCISGRSRYDMSHYPIYPWVLTNYDSATLDLKDARNFRDLSKPIGALNHDRLVHLKSRMNTLHFATKSNSDVTESSDAKCTCDDDKCDMCLLRMWNSGFYLYCSHYSTPALVVFFLIRLQPECQLRLYSGKFDAAARTFKSIAETYHNVVHGHSTFFELIPEFYSSDGSFLRNQLNVTTQDGRLCDVELPRWAGNSSSQFVNVMRSALESEHVSKHLHEWIDLVFGYKQAGLESIKSDNTFHPLSYLSSVRVGKLSMTPATQNLVRTMEPKAISVHVREFGQAPIILFENPHPQRLRHPQWQATDNPVPNAPWFIYVSHNRDIFGVSDPETGDEPRIGRTITQGSCEGHLRSMVVDGTLRMRRVPKLSDTITGAGFATSDIVYALTQTGSVMFHSIDQSVPTISASIDRSPLTCSTWVKQNLCICSGSGYMTLCNVDSVISASRGYDANMAARGDALYFHSEDQGTFFYRQQLHEDGISCVAFSDDVITSGGFDETVKQFQVTNSDIRMIGIFDDHNGPLASVFSSSGLLLTATVGGSLTLWDPRSPHSPVWNHEIGHQSRSCQVISCSISNRYIQMVSSGDHPVIFWDVRMLNSLSSCSGFKRELSIPNFDVLGGLCDPNDCIGLSGTQDGVSTLQFYDINTRSVLAQTAFHDMSYPSILAVNYFNGSHRMLVANTSGDIYTVCLKDSTT
ncbi:Beige/BEACH domain containing protein [Babesia bovis T2Bo]|uniref:Beige/BEACH domain containing protein n=1 Tax=Babesia bovis T2Bo TaxID=484906 RepID=UPI001E04A8A4|nr:Beige/BEACH domain containing protein [Babesia bovis T2Bo]EDO05840.2 Beige/BEACH domain containing protein [Babesia bovis T2Bo]